MFVIPKGPLLIQIQLFLIAQPTDRPAFLVEDANRPDADFDKEDAQFNKVLLDTRLNNRVLDLRVRASTFMSRDLI